MPATRQFVTVGDALSDFIRATNAGLVEIGTPAEARSWCVALVEHDAEHLNRGELPPQVRLPDVPYTPPSQLMSTVGLPIIIGGTSAFGLAFLATVVLLMDVTLAELAIGTVVGGVVLSFLLIPAIGVPVAIARSKRDKPRQIRHAAIMMQREFWFARSSILSDVYNGHLLPQQALELLQAAVPSEHGAPVSQPES